MRRGLLNSAGYSALLVAALWAPPVLAQDGEAAGDEAATQNTTQNKGGLNEIIVTAQRKAESLQDAAIAIDAVGGEDLVSKGISQAENLTKTVPALTVTNGGGSNTSIFIRGVGNITNSSYNDPAVAPSYDGVVLARAAGAFGAAFYDLERVEVLKGPQGILYGRNATGGAVNIIPAKPVLGERSAGFTVSFGNYDAVSAQGHLNLPLGDNAALRVAASRDVHDGYNKDGSDDLKRSGLRAQLLFEPTDTLSIRIGGDYTHVGGVGAGSSYIGNYTSGSDGYTFTASGLGNSEGLYTDAANAYRQTALGAPGFGFLSAIDEQQFTDNTYWGVNAEIKLKTGLGDLTFIPAYRKTKAESLFYGPAFNTAYTNERDEQFSSELRLSGSVGMIDYVVGGFYFDENIDNTGVYNQEFVLPIQHYTHKTTSYAGFGQLTANLSDSFRLIGGLRYTHDKKSIDGLINNFITFCGSVATLITPPDSFANGCAVDGALPRYPTLTSTADTVNWLISNGYIASGSTDEAAYQVYDLTSGAGQILKTYYPVVKSGSFSRVTWKAGAEFDAAPDSLLYATVESGYRAGGFQLSEGNPSYKPEFITAFTLGSKNRFLNNKVQLNIEAFYWKYKDQQINYFTYSGGVLVNQIDNAGRADIKGFDVDLTAKPWWTTTFNAKVQFLDTEYKELTLTTASPRDNINCPSSVAGTDGSTTILAFDCSGKPLLYSPKWTVNLGVEHVVPVSDNLEFVGSVQTAWRDKQWGAFEYLDFEKIPAYWTTDATLTARLPNSGFSVTAYINNIENKRRISSPQYSPIGFAVARYTAPQTYGIRVSAQF
ncbi:TonB-dependent receptor [Novosphingobium sp. 1949]|uniref:TonB-dependent receptor n=1 Tax=Novosphingobium organovorum TaxID=2930092 RepID=A0ABT0BEZ0_9SPHN|nr:TonB-dependent receptor [Novosphingobium organovorum]MCJ2183596.1 TonB-dependent receptor [Novosphingobium organovorum]